MSPYNKKEGRGFGGDRGGRPSFKKNYDGPRQMYAATCANCGRTTEVPFRPTGERPVFCRDCFDKQSPQGKFERREAPRQFERREAPHFAKPTTSDRAIEELKTQLAGMSRKLDTAVSLLAEVAASLQQPAQEAPGLSEVVQTVAKKAAKKKKTK